MVGNVDKPTSTVKPETPIATGEVPLFIPESLPHEYLPTGEEEDPKVETPDTLESDFTFTVITAFVAAVTTFATI